MYVHAERKYFRCGPSTQPRKAWEIKSNRKRTHRYCLADNRTIPINIVRYMSSHQFFSRSNSEENKKTVGNAQANLYFVAFCVILNIFRPCIQHMLGKDLFLFCVMSSLESQRNCEFKVESNISGASLTRIRMDWTLAGKLFDIRQLI